MERPIRKVVLAQLNVPNNAITIPLAAGYLKAMAYSAGLMKYADIEILDKKSNNAFGDSHLIAYIIGKQPDIMGFSCYVWNIDRTMYIIDQIKSRLPHLKIICGGAEIYSQYGRYLKDENVDIIVRGEGELTFIALLRHCMYNKPTLDEIEGIAFKRGEKIIVTPERKPIEDINIIPSPYLLGFINAEDYGRLFIETYRGCIEKCSYCNWSRNFHGIRYFNETRIKNEIKLAQEKRVICQIIDPIFNLPRNLTRLSKSIAEVSKDNPVELVIEGRAEYINQRTIASLLQCNVSRMYIGLQSINPVALANIHRWFNRKLFIRGIRFLKKAGISFKVDIIIGLPGDTERSIKKNHRFLHDIVGPEKVHFEILRVQPGTELRKQVRKFNLKFHRQKPYFIFSTNSLSRQALKRAFCLYQRDFYEETCASQLDNLKTLYPVLPFLLSQQRGSKNIGQRHLLCEGNSNIFSYVTVEVKGDTATIRKMSSLADMLKRRIALQSLIYFQCSQIEDNYSSIRGFLNRISITNPFAAITIIIETEKENSINKKIVAKLHNAIHHAPNYCELQKSYYRTLQDIKGNVYKCKFIIIQPYTMKNAHHGNETSEEEISFVSKAVLTEDMDWKNLLQEWFRSPDKKLLIDFIDYAKNIPFAMRVVRYTEACQPRNKFIYFFDYISQAFYDKVFIKTSSLTNHIKEFENITRRIPNKIIYVDKNLNPCVMTYDLSDMFLRYMDFKEYKNCDYQKS